MSVSQVSTGRTVSMATIVPRSVEAMPPQDLPLIRTMRERMRAGEPYAADTGLVELGDRAADLTDALDAVPARDRARRQELLERLLAAVGTDAEVRSPLRVAYGSGISVGARCRIGPGLVADEAATITIGDDVRIDAHVQLLTPVQPLEAERRRAGWEAARPVVLGDDVWLGAGVVVMPGVTIGAGTVVGAGSVVVSDLPAGVLAVGSPAKVIRQLG